MEGKNMGLRSPKIYIEWCIMEFKDHLKVLREHKNLTQEELAKAVGIAKNTYIGYEKGEREPRLTELKKLSRILGVTLGQLCLDVETRTVNDNLIMLFEEVQDFTEEEINTFIEVTEALVIKHHSEKIRYITKYVKER
jgi:transcriptional regulator with XRE-family HTH domain